MHIDCTVFQGHCSWIAVFITKQLGSNLFVYSVYLTPAEAMRIVAFAWLFSLIPLDAAVTITGHIYCDNYFEFYFNGQQVFTDPLDFTPHNAASSTMKPPAAKSMPSFAKTMPATVAMNTPPPIRHNWAMVLCLPNSRTAPPPLAPGNLTW